MIIREYNFSALLIEDNEIIGDLMLRRLQKLFKECHWARSAEDGLQIWKTSLTEVIIVDQLLPGMLGSEFVSLVRASGCNVPILGITASAMGSEIDDLERAGATRATSKPISMSTLISFCEMYIKSD